MSWPVSLRWIVRYKPFDSSMSRILARRLTAFTRQPTILFFNAGGLGETFLGQFRHSANFSPPSPQRERVGVRHQCFGVSPQLLPRDCNRCHHSKSATL